MLVSLENYYWRYTSASELVNMILAFVETRAYQLFQRTEFLNLSESMVQMIMCRNLEVPEVRKFEAMLAWARHKIRTKTSSKLDAKLEFKCVMERLARDLKLYRISPQELIKVTTLILVWGFVKGLIDFVRLCCRRRPSRTNASWRRWCSRRIRACIASKIRISRNARKDCKNRIPDSPNGSPSTTAIRQAHVTLLTWSCAKFY